MTAMARRRPFCGNCGSHDDLFYFKMPTEQANSLMWLIRCNDCMGGRGAEHSLIIAKCHNCEVMIWTLIIRSENPEDIKCPRCGQKRASPVTIEPTFDPRKG